MGSQSSDLNECNIIGETAAPVKPRQSTGSPSTSPGGSFKRFVAPADGPARKKNKASNVAATARPASGANGASAAGAPATPERTIDYAVDLQLVDKKKRNKALRGILFSGTTRIRSGPIRTPDPSRGRVFRGISDLVERPISPLIYSIALPKSFAICPQFFWMFFQIEAMNPRTLGSGVKPLR